MKSEGKLFKVKDYRLVELKHNAILEKGIAERIGKAGHEVGEVERFKYLGSAEWRAVGSRMILNIRLIVKG